MRRAGPGRVPSRVEIVPVGPGEPAEELLGWLAGALEERLRVPVGRGRPLQAREDWRRGGNGRLNSNPIVDALIARDSECGAEAPDRWALAVTEEDLFAPGRSFVFGEAAQGGAWAVIALARLRDDLWSTDRSRLLRERILKEALHELGHLAGLEHCERPECVMFPSETLEDTDRKSDARCPGCEAAAPGGAGVDRPPPSR